MPLQVYIERSLSRKLRKIARERGISQSELVRRFIREGLTRELPGDLDPAMRVIGIGTSGIGDLAERHDGYLAEAYAGRKKRARYADQPLSLVDAVSFSVMRSRTIKQAFAFDRHFQIAGFTVVPER